MYISADPKHSNRHYIRFEFWFLYTLFEKLKSSIVPNAHAHTYIVFYILLRYFIYNKIEHLIINAICIVLQFCDHCVALGFSTLKMYADVLNQCVHAVCI